jgi:hypothetical protein
MLVLNNNNNVGNNNNTYQYNFTKGNFSIPESTEIMITNIQIPYSWFNISALIGNNKITFNFPSGGSGYTSSIITIPDGFYTTTTFNYYIESWMISKGYYLIDNTTNKNVYYVDISYNVSSYDNQILTFPVPTSLPSGFSLPSGYTTSTIFNGLGFPSYTATPYFTFPQLTTTPTIGNFLGFGSTTGTVNVPSLLGSGGNIVCVVTAGVITLITIVNGGSNYVNPTITFPTGTGAIINLIVVNGIITGSTIINGGTGYSSGGGTINAIGGASSTLSTITPQGSTVNSLVIRCSLVRNNVANPPDILDSFSIPAGSAFGANINYAPSVEKFVKATEGTFNNFVITICDQNLNPIYANDNNVLITLLMKFPKKK